MLPKNQLLMDNQNVITDLFQKPKDNFDAHIAISGNTKILFSGEFGIGKTTFLRHYFDSSHEQYNIIHLFPINYSILENEDIISYLKYDILLSLFSNKDYPIKPDYYSFLKSWDSFMVDNIGQVIATIMLLVPKIGKQLNSFSKELKQLALDFKNYKKPKENSELDEINKFLSQFHESEGGLYETNVITLIIQEWLKDIARDGKENILIIDDLDRIDPNHIFRLLNVFSAHFDSTQMGESRNKFGFDKVLMVCDVENIKGIYKAKYGQGADFNGYLDKFYSKEIFRFDNQENILSIIDGVVSTIYIKGYHANMLYENHPDSDYIKEQVLLFLRALVLSRAINLRALFKLYKSSFSLDKKFLTVSGTKISVSNNIFLAAINILYFIVGDLNLMKEKLLKLNKLTIHYDQNVRLFLGNLAFLLDIERGKSMFQYPYGNPSNDLEFTIHTDSGKTYEGVYKIVPPQRNNSISYTGVLSNLIVDSEKVDMINTFNNEIDAADLVKELIKRIFY